MICRVHANGLDCKKKYVLLNKSRNLVPRNLYKNSFIVKLELRLSMGSISKSFSLFLIVILALSSIMIAKPALAQTSAPAVEWQKIIIPDGISATCIIQTSDGGYAVGGDCDYKTGSPPGYLVKLVPSGNMQWNQSYAKYAASIYGDNIEALVQTSDGGYAFLLGSSQLIKTNSEGKVQWNLTFNGADVASSMVKTSDGGYAVAGDATINQIQNGRYESNFWLAKVNSVGTLLWNETFGKEGDTAAASVIQTSDGGYALAGRSNAYSTAGEYDFMVVKTDSPGNQQWLETFAGASGDSEANSIIQTSDGGYVLAGETAYASGGTVAWLVKTDSSGNMTWNRTYGGVAAATTSLNGTVSSNFVTESSGSEGDIANCVIQTSDGGLAFVGGASYAPPNAGSLVWLVKTDSSGNTQWNETFGVPFNPYSTWAGTSLIETSDGAFAIAGFDQPAGTPWFGSYLVIKTEPTLPAPSPSPAPTIPEFPTWIILPLFAVIILSTVFIKKRIPEKIGSLDCNSSFFARKFFSGQKKFMPNFLERIQQGIPEADVHGLLILLRLRSLFSPCIRARV
jgi:hypothetical protein